MDDIWFGEGGNQGWMFSNFAAFAIEFGGVVWPTSEHLYQALKFLDSEKQEMIRQTRSAYAAKKLAKSFAPHSLRLDWTEVRLKVMEQVVRTKVEQHEYVKRKLLETGDAALVENNPSDSFWACGSDGAGENHLGRILMKIRAELRAK